MCGEQKIILVLCFNFDQGLKVLLRDKLALKKDKKICMLSHSSHSFAKPSPFREILIQYEDIL